MNYGLLLAFLPLIFLAVPFYFLNRNNRTHKLLKEALHKCTPKDENCWEVLSVVKRYRYEQILYSFRSIRSFRKELLGDIRNIKRKGTKK